VTNSKEINEICSKIVGLINPKKVILFGSYGTSAYKETSDIDLLVVVKDENKPNLNDVLRKLDVRKAVDLIIRTESDIAFRLKNKDFFISDIFENGQVLYESSL
jgi:uncharacterized protein